MKVGGEYHYNGWTISWRKARMETFELRLEKDNYEWADYFCLKDLRKRKTIMYYVFHIIKQYDEHQNINTNWRFYK
tara:strand:+ start:10978 stop:11205 length:228 start_codon:yes stop_codon:yes gene_type:complete